MAEARRDLGGCTQNGRACPSRCVRKDEHLAGAIPSLDQGHQNPNHPGCFLDGNATSMGPPTTSLFAKADLHFAQASGIDGVLYVRDR